MAAVAHALNATGLKIGEDRFARLVETAMSRFAPAGSADPAADLSKHDAKALHDVGADISRRRPRETDPRAAGVADYVALIAGSHSVADAGRKVGLDGSRIRHRLAAGALLGIKHGRGWVLPAWQFTAAGAILPGMALIGPLLRPLHPVVAAGFMTTPQPELTIGRRVHTPQSWLAGGGDAEEVAILARALSEQF